MVLHGKKEGGARTKYIKNTIVIDSGDGSDGGNNVDDGIGDNDRK